MDHDTNHKLLQESKMDGLVPEGFPVLAQTKDLVVTEESWIWTRVSSVGSLRVVALLRSGVPPVHPVLTDIRGDWLPCRF